MQQSGGLSLDAGLDGIDTIIFLPPKGRKMQTNLASSSKTPDSEQESGVFLCSAVHSMLVLTLLNSLLLRKHRPHPY